MKKLVFLVFLLIISIFVVSLQAAHIPGDIVQYEMINGRQYKVIYQMTTEDKLYIYYFNQDGIPQGKWKLAGVEIFKDGELIEDTFDTNNR